MLKATLTVDIARPPIDVWRLVSNHENDLRWQSVVRAVCKLSPGPVRVGSRFRHTLQLLGMQMEAELEVEETRSGELHVFSVTGGPLLFTTRVLFRPSPTGTHVRTEIEGRPAGLSQLAAVAVSKGRRREIQSDLERLKRLIEAGELK
jgi:uncharacterized membrane protein